MGAVQSIKNAIKASLVRKSATGALVAANNVPIAADYAIAQNASGMLLPACAAGTTVSQAGTTVTVVNGGASPTAHNIPATSFDGMKVYFPGSPSIAAGWYPNFTRTSTTAYTFTNATATVGSESVNGGAEYVTETTFESFTLPGGAMGPSGTLTANAYFTTNNSATQKVALVKIGASQVGYLSVTTGASGRIASTLTNRGVENRQVGNTIYSLYASSNSTSYLISNTSVDQTITVTGRVFAANSYLVRESVLISVRYGA